ncbi:MAG: OpgC domain-containing protein [Rhodospirillales bacterium]|nr:OpgC domain-containing protein [Rhodospirillales bacterium]
MRPAAPPDPEARLLRRPPRDLRVDVLRGWLQLTIIASHVAGFASRWLIHGAWGYSDSSEQFVLLSGLMLGSVFTLKRHTRGTAAAVRDMLGRAARLWRARLLTLLAFGAMVIAWNLTGLASQVRIYGFPYLMQAPLHAAALAAALLFNPAYVDVLSVFILCMLALPLFLVAVERAGAWALALPVGLWGAVQLWHLPAPDAVASAPTAFNVLGWQLLFMLGAYAGRRKLLTGRALPEGAWLTWLAGGIVALGFALRLAGHLGIDPGFRVPVTHFTDKLDLWPLGLVHALALAILVARLTPREAAWMHRWPARVLAAIGRHSLAVYCSGLFLSFLGERLLALAGPGRAWLEAPLIAAACALAGLVACWHEGYRPRLALLATPARAEGGAPP